MHLAHAAKRFVEIGRPRHVPAVIDKSRVEKAVLPIQPSQRHQNLLFRGTILTRAEDFLSGVEQRSVNDGREQTFAAEPRFRAIENLLFAELNRGAIPNAVADIDFVPQEPADFAVCPRLLQAAAYPLRIQDFCDRTFRFPLVHKSREYPADNPNFLWWTQY